MTLWVQALMVTVVIGMAGYYIAVVSARLTRANLIVALLRRRLAALDPNDPALLGSYLIEGRCHEPARPADTARAAA